MQDRLLPVTVKLYYKAYNKVVHHFYAGIDPQSSEYILDPKQTFETPHLALTFSKEGLSGASRNFHRWARTEGMLHRGMKTGDILLNSWEGLYFDIDEERMLQMMDDISKFGGELFVMDDGWFGDKYPRLNDSSSLGDWVVDKNKLPNGLDALTKAARERGIKFGIWIEPEMVNTKSELFERHPEWALQTKGRQLKLGRGGTQLVLDMTNPEVQDFVFGVVDNLLTQNPDIAYIKWDANASIQNYGSLYLPKNRQHEPLRRLPPRTAQDPPAHREPSIPTSSFRIAPRVAAVPTMACCPTLTSSGPRTTPTPFSASTSSGAPASSSLPTLWPATSTTAPIGTQAAASSPSSSAAMWPCRDGSASSCSQRT